RRRRPTHRPALQSPGSCGGATRRAAWPGLARSFVHLSPGWASVGTDDGEQSDTDDVAGHIGELGLRRAGWNRAGAHSLPPERVVRAQAEVRDARQVDQCIYGESVVAERLVDCHAVAEVTPAGVDVEFLEKMIADLPVRIVGPDRAAHAG